MKSFDEFRTRFGPWALVAGASMGIGAEYARLLAGRGLNLVLVARGQERLQTLAQELRGRFPVQIRTIALDLGQADTAGRLAAETRGLEVGLLICNAAAAPVAGFFDLPLEEHLRAVDTNIRTPLALVYNFGRPMRERGRGGIILMSSLSSLQGSALISVYAATKSFNLILAEGLWDELRGAGVAVLACLPSTVATPGYLSGLPEDARRPPRAMPAGRVAEEALNALGGGPDVIPGPANRAAAFGMRRLFPRRAAIRLVGRTLKRMYPRRSPGAA